MHLRQRAAAVMLGAAVVGLTGASLASGAASASFFLDSYNANNASGGNFATAPIALVKGVSYRLKVHGTFSAWAVWPHTCGRPGRSAVYPSPAADHQPATPVGNDAVFRFAQPSQRGKCSANLPIVTGTFQVNLGSGWKPFVPSGGYPAEPTGGNHAYVARIVGQGAKPQFRIVDWHTSDNNGRLLISIT